MLAYIAYLRGREAAQKLPTGGKRKPRAKPKATPQPREQKLADADVLAIRRRKHQGETSEALAEEFSVSTRMIDLVVTYRRRANVTA